MADKTDCARLELSDGYFLQSEPYGFSLVKYVDVMDKKNPGETKRDEDGEIVRKEVKLYYGTVYQALQSYVKIIAGEGLFSIPKMIDSVTRAMDSIREAEDEIKSLFRTEVRKS